MGNSHKRIRLRSASHLAEVTRHVLQLRLRYDAQVQSCRGVWLAPLGLCVPPRSWSPALPRAEGLWQCHHPRQLPAGGLPLPPPTSLLVGRMPSAPHRRASRPPACTHTRCRRAGEARQATMTPVDRRERCIERIAGIAGAVRWAAPGSVQPKYSCGYRRARSALSRASIDPVLNFIQPPRA